MFNLKQGGKVHLAFLISNEKMDLKFNTYKLLNDKKPQSWQLPLNDVLIAKLNEKNEPELKGIKYIPGMSSFYAEDIKGDLTSKSIWFSRGLLRVPKIDKLTNALLQAHPWFNKYYELHDTAIASKRELERLRVKDEARKLIEESDTEKIRASALAIFGQKAFSWDADTCELELRKFADQQPEKLQKELNSKDYESKYLASLSLAKEIVKTNLGKTAVVWNDTTEGIIIKLAKGENAISKFGEYLSTRTDESEMVLQEIMLRVEKMDIPEEKPQDLKQKLSQKDQELADKEAEIAKLKAMLEGKSSDNALDQVRAKYEEVLNKKVPPRFTNDIEWLQKAIDEAEK